MQVNVTVGMHLDVKERLDVLSQKLGRSRNSIMVEGIRDVLEKYEQ